MHTQAVVGVLGATVILPSSVEVVVLAQQALLKGNALRGKRLPAGTARALVFSAFCRAASVGGDGGRESRTSRPMTPAPRSAIRFTSLPGSSRDQGQRPDCRKLSSSITTSPTTEG